MPSDFYKFGRFNERINVLTRDLNERIKRETIEYNIIRKYNRGYRLKSS